MPLSEEQVDRLRNKYDDKLRRMKEKAVLVKLKKDLKKGLEKGGDIPAKKSGQCLLFDYRTDGMKTIKLPKKITRTTKITEPDACFHWCIRGRHDWAHISTRDVMDEYKKDCDSPICKERNVHTR